jgi:hypothetical protein|tara:strand:- start:162 stop:413 length:252 start_codon:yes stop_codon:yes gene_type:complete
MKTIVISAFCIFFSGILRNDVPNNPIFYEGEVTNTIFEEVTAQDSVVHWFLDLKEGQKYCWHHMEYENLRIVHKKLDTLAFRP